MLIRGVVDDEVDQNADAAAVRLTHELDEVVARAEPRIDSVVVADVVAVVAPRRRLEGRQPDRVDAQRIEVVETPRESLEVAASIAVRIEECLDVEAVDDRVLVPEVSDHVVAASTR